MSKIQNIHARQILDSRNMPTVSATVTLEDGSTGQAAVPSGASTGEHEAFELRDGDPNVYNGNSVFKAIENIHAVILPGIRGLEAVDQKLVDDTMIKLDGTKNKSRLGANALLAVSMATAIAESVSQKLPLYKYLKRFSLQPHADLTMPYAMFNVINGGRHAAHSSDFQEYMIIPMQPKSFAHRLECASEIFQALKKLLGQKGLPQTVGDEGGFAPPVPNNTQGLEYIMEAIGLAGYKAGENVFLATDIAASEFYKKGKYVLATEKRKLGLDEMIKMIKDLSRSYPIISIEDPLEENDFVGWARLTQSMGSNVQVVGDDLYTTNVERLQKGIDLQSSTAILIKPNQIGTLSETFEAIRLAQSHGLKTIMSHRSGETEDTFIADLAVGLRVEQVKMGSLSRSERLAKYNRLLEIEEEIN